MLLPGFYPVCVSVCVCVCVCVSVCVFLMISCRERDVSGNVAVTDESSADKQRRYQVAEQHCVAVAVAVAVAFVHTASKNPSGES